MTNHLAVTTFSKRGFEVYGKRFLDSFFRHWTIPLVLWSEDDIPYKHPRLDKRMLWCDADYKAFVAAFNRQPYIGRPSFPNGQLIRFAHKVFAMTGDQGQGWDWLVWLDADVETVATVNQDALAELCPSDTDLCYLGRDHLDQWPETGFLAFRQGAVLEYDGAMLLAGMRQLYVSGEIAHLPEDHWHDAAAFDLERKAMEKLIPMCNLSASARPKDGLDVWPHTLLAKYMLHRKGPRQKLHHYGSTA